MEITTELVLKILKFGITGLSGMVVDFGATWLGRERLKWNQYFANSCGFTLAVINNYIINRFWTFESKEAWMPEFGRFVLFSTVGLALNNLLLYVFHEKLKLNFYLAKAIAIGCVFIWNFVVNYEFNFHS
ncbi:MAG TPA: GtrA family protein [Panacibacter sp.]|nr:GtrA family protein [Panacibacter sp.]HNP45009.1 GtrA family protein [Panacibacter sp.]